MKNNVVIGISLLFVLGAFVSPAMAQNDTNETGFTESEKFGMTMQLVESIPWICEVEDKSDIMEEACYLQEKYD